MDFEGVGNFAECSNSGITNYSLIILAVVIIVLLSQHACYWLYPVP